MNEIVLVALNARWSHASFALRYLKANLGALHDRCSIIERTISDRPVDVAEQILAANPRIVGLSVYIWNATEMLALARVLRALNPSLIIVAGGPEISHEAEAQALTGIVDHVVQGEGEDAFRVLCERLLNRVPVSEKLIPGGRPDLSTLVLPYALYDDVDVKDRVVYVEASRGCPFSCEFCLSALDEKMRSFPLDRFLGEMQTLLDRGLQQFKFIDRTFNLKIDTTEKIIRFFLQRMRPGLFVHFEMIPDRLPPSLRALLQQFPAGSVQLEVGIQTFDPDVGARIQRRQNVKSLEDNLRFLRRETGAHVHADLIVGLPGEDLQTFALGFDRLVALEPHEIQVGILKRLRGAPIARHTESFGLIFSEEPPYEVLQTSTVSFANVQRMKRFARYFDLVKNSGRLIESSKLLLAGPSAFASFMRFSDWLFEETGASHGIALKRLADLCARYLIEEEHHRHEEIEAAVMRDLAQKEAQPKGIPARQARHVAVS